MIFSFTEDIVSIVDFGDSGKCLNTEIELKAHFMKEIRCLALVGPIQISRLSLKRLNHHLIKVRSAHSHFDRTSGEWSPDCLDAPGMT